MVETTNPTVSTMIPGRDNGATRLHLDDTGPQMSAWMAGRFVMWDWFRRYTQPDELIDELIRRNRARPVEGMSSADWRTINRVGAERWREMARAQAHSGRRDAHGAAAVHVIPLRKAG